MLHAGVEPWVKHVKRQMALREAKQQPRAVAKKLEQQQGGKMPNTSLLFEQELFDV